jgi:hypothetical protein
MRWNFRAPPSLFVVSRNAVNDDEPPVMKHAKTLTIKAIKSDGRDPRQKKFIRNKVILNDNLSRKQ